MSEETTTTVRDELKELSRDEYLKRTRMVMEADAAELGLGEDMISSAKTKADLYEAIVAIANLPDPALRGQSDEKIKSPVARVWRIADRMYAEAEDGETPRRKDIIQACVDDGVAFYTARTQVQSWFTASNRGTKRLEQIDSAELPKAIRNELYGEEHDADE